MHFVVSATYGPTDPTRAMLPFIFAASAVQSGDQVTAKQYQSNVKDLAERRSFSLRLQPQLNKAVACWITAGGVTT
jgi:hypothetical protein